ncbi:MAG TPA: ankyrin repeat domain-containing protein [Sphingomicrobium sp.]|nr:ankyrin repeat domain-containing protein [Sphingomicrobium sp.]
MHRLKSFFFALVAMSLPVAATGQSGAFDGQMFIRAMVTGDNGTALQMLQSTPSLVNARDSKGDTALIIAIQVRNAAWTATLLKKDADPDLASRDGTTPMTAAARIGFRDAVAWLIEKGADVDSENRMGETALIIAVQRRESAIVRLLLDAGADPDKTDSAAGYSARDYAKRDNRNPELLRMIEAKKPKP